MNIASQQVDYPKVLVISPAVFNLYSGGGVTLTNFFYGWPKDKLAMIYNDGISRDNSVCKKFYELTSEDMRWCFPFSFIQKHKDGNINTNLKSNINNTIFSFILGEEMPKIRNISDSLKKWIETFKPDIVYSIISSSVFYIDITLDIIDEFKIPIIVHIMDDWQTTKYRSGVLGFYMRYRLNSNLKLLIKKASLRMSICDYMSEEYKNRYGFEFIPFHNAIDIETWKSKVKKNWIAGKPFRIMYHGSVLPNSHLNSLLDICQVVEKLNKAGLGIEVLIHTPKLYVERYRDLFKNFSSVFMNSTFIQVEDMPSFLAKPDLLLLPVNFDKNSTDFIRYSMPTKVPEYMMSGTPVLLYGPSDMASVRYAIMEKWGYVVTNRNLEELEIAIVNLMKDESLRMKLGKRSQDLAVKNHDINRVRKEFQKTIIEAAY